MYTETMGERAIWNRYVVAETEQCHSVDRYELSRGQ